MNFAKTTAIGATLALGAIAVTAATPALARKSDADAAPKQDYSPAFRQAAQPLQAAMKAKDLAAEKATLPAVQAAATTPDDKYQASVMALQVAQQSDDLAGIVAAADAALASGRAPPEAMPVLLDAKGRSAYNSNNFVAADDAFTQLLKLKPDDGDSAIVLAAIKAREGQGAQALPIIDQAITAKKAANQPVPEEWYRRGLQLAYDNKPPIPASVIKFGEGLVATYPSPKAWRDSLLIYRGSTRLDIDSNLDLLRLLRAAGGLAGEQDYYEYASIADEKALPAEAMAVINEGIGSNMVENKSVTTSNAIAKIKASSGPKVASLKTALPELDKKARASADGEIAANIGDAYLGYGEYAQAADLYKVALQKGRVDPNIVNVRLGFALERLGQKPAALQALGMVTGPRQPLAQYWTIWVNQQP